MARCAACDKSTTFSLQVSHSNRKSNRSYKPNLKRVKVIENGATKHIIVCTRCIRSGKINRG